MTDSPEQQQEAQDAAREAGKIEGDYASLAEHYFLKGVSWQSRRAPEAPSEDAQRLAIALKALNEIWNSTIPDRRGHYRKGTADKVCGIACEAVGRIENLGLVAELSQKVRRISAQDIAAAIRSLASAPACAPEKPAEYEHDIREAAPGYSECVKCTSLRKALSGLEKQGGGK